MGHLIDTLREHRDEIIVIARQHHADNVRLFGSVARGDDLEDSDVDFLVDFQPDSTLFDQIRLTESLSNKLGCKVDIISSRALNRHLAHRIQQEAIAL